MSRHPLRRAHLIAPFGVGSLPVFPDGASMIIAGLDHWFPEDGPAMDVSEFQVEEWRLERRLGVDHFRLPPDYRPGWDRTAEEESINHDLKIPALRFPRWHACSWCKRLDLRSMTEKGRLTCRWCEKQGKKWTPIAQVQFVVMCTSGHLDDFPFRQWVHRSGRPSCQLPMTLTGSGGSLVSVRVKCECGKSRNLSGVTQGADEAGGRSFLTDALDPDGPAYVCRGRRPWLGEAHDEPCGLPLVGGLRSASNTYFSETVRSIYVPPASEEEATSGLLDALESPRVRTLRAGARVSGGRLEPPALRKQFPGLFDPWSDEAIARALALVDGSDGGPAASAVDDEQTAGEQDFREIEFAALSADTTSSQLVVRTVDPQLYEQPVASLFGGIGLIERLRVTTAFTGFTRVRTNEAGGGRADELWAEPPSRDESWLPASIVYGEGIFLQLDVERLLAWAGQREVISRAGTVDRAYETSRRTGRPERDITPALIATHTLSHLLINQMAFESGYSAASLAERLYVRDDRAAVLIYTASGDSDGTLGGLVRLGRPGNFERILRAALERAEWCSSDPICMELGDSGGQGPDSCNLAACHSCAIVPETACEEFNRFLDRGLLVGDHAGRVPSLIEFALTPAG